MRILRSLTARGSRFSASVALLAVGGATFVPAVGCGLGADEHGCGGAFNPTRYMGACGCVDTEEIASGFQCNRDSASGADWTAPPSNGSNNGYGGRQNAPVRDAGEQDATADASVCDSGADADADADASSSCTERSPAPTSDVDASDARP